MLNAAVKRAVLSSSFNISIAAGGVDAEKQSRTTLCKPFHTRGALLEKARAIVTVLQYGMLSITPFEPDLRARAGLAFVNMDLIIKNYLMIISYNERRALHSQSTRNVFNASTTK